MNYELMKKRATQLGQTRHDRIVGLKYKTFQNALKDAYEHEEITLSNGDKWICLINPSRLTEEYDTKVLSIDFEAGVEEGDVFYWDRTGRWWIVTMQQHTEEAYFRATINRCDQEIEIDDEWYWISLRGPVETDFEWWSKHGLTGNNLNYSIKITIKKNSKTVNYFTRGKKIKLRQAYPDAETGEMLYDYHNWMVAATDKYSQDTTIEVYLTEEYDNDMEDARNKEIEQKEEEEANNTDPVVILGDSIIYGYDEDKEYRLIGYVGVGYWKLSKNGVVEIVAQDDLYKTVTVNSITGRTAQVVLSFVDNNNNVLASKTITNQMA